MNEGTNDGREEGRKGGWGATTTIRLSTVWSVRTPLCGHLCAAAERAPLTKWATNQRLSFTNSLTQSLTPSLLACHPSPLSHTTEAMTDPTQSTTNDLIIDAGHMFM
eukprot:GHVU01010058.1.p1 GENE.GHVU01010058.1~~GHVU01010058.1.p1  ORF type:complete len:107 (-),score=4.50 GHVU01010058.1:72-392(-)